MTRGRRLVFRPGGRVEVEDFDVPQPGSGQMLVEVQRTQISAGSEMNGYRRMLQAEGAAAASGTGAAAAASGTATAASGAASGGVPDRRTSGYTAVGRAVAVGPDVDGIATGDRVLVFGNHASHSLADLNDRESWRSYPDRLPDGVNDEPACYAVLGDVALHGVRRGQLQIDESVAVFGAVVVGQLTVQFVRMSGAHPIVAVDLYARRLDLARQGGATHGVDASKEDSVAAVQAAIGGGAQTVFHCSPVAQLLQTAMRVAGNRAKVVMTGSAPGIAEIGLQEDLLRKELTILGNYESGLSAPHPYWPWTRQRNRAACYRMIESGELSVDRLTSHVVAPERAEEMYRMMLAGGDSWMSIFFAWD